MLRFLKFLEKQMATHPEWIEPVDRAQLKRIGKLVTGVKTDLGRKSFIELRVMIGAREVVELLGGRGELRQAVKTFADLDAAMQSGFPVLRSIESYALVVLENLVRFNLGELPPHPSSSFGESFDTHFFGPNTFRA